MLVLRFSCIVNYTREVNMIDDKIDKYKNEKISRLVLGNVVPSMISMVMVLIYNLADTFFIGRTGNAFMVAAVSQGTPAFFLFMSVGTIFGIGGTSLISRLLGMGKQKEARQAASFAFWTGLIIGILGMFLFWAAIDPLCRVLGAGKETIEFVYSYLRIVAVGIPFLIISSTFSNILRAEGKPGKAMKGMVMGNLFNIILDPVLILFLNMDIRGAAIATVLANILSASYYILHYVKGNSILSIHPSEYRAGGGIAAGVFSIGIPASLNSFLVGISAIFMNNFLIAHGNMAVAGMGVASKMGMMLAILLVGFGLGVQPLFGYFYGAGNRKRFMETLKYSLVLSTVISLVLTAVVYQGTTLFIGAFLEKGEAYTLGVEFTRILIYGGPVLGMLFVFNNAVQGMGRALPSLILSVSRQGLIYIPLLFMIDRISDSPTMLIAAQPIADFITVAAAAILFSHAFRTGFSDSGEPSEQEYMELRERA